MKQLTMTLRKASWLKGQTIKLPSTHHAIWIINGEIEKEGKIIGLNSGLYAHGDKYQLSVVGTQADVLLFSLSCAESLKEEHGNSSHMRTPSENKENSTKLLTDTFSTNQSQGLIRLDSVSFPPGVQAYKHVHAGPGIRYLTKGSLSLESENHTQTMTVGDSWFEDTGTAVQATGRVSR